MLGQPFQDIWVRGRWVRYSFAAGILVGVILGWMFHGLIAFVIRFGLIALFLAPLAAALYFWWRLKQASPPPADRPPPRTLVTWQEAGGDAHGPAELSGPRSRPSPRVVWDDLGDWADIDPAPGRRAARPDHTDGIPRDGVRVPISGRVRPGSPVSRGGPRHEDRRGSVDDDFVGGSGREA